MLKFYYSGAKSIGEPQPRPEKSLGGLISTSPVLNGEVNNLFEDASVVTIQEGKTQTIAIFLRNEGATPLLNLYLGYTMDSEAISSIQMGVVPVDSVTPLTERIDKPEGLPMSVEFYDLLISDATLPAAENGAGFIMESFGSGEVLALWIQRRVPITALGFDVEAEFATFKANNYLPATTTEPAEKLEFIVYFDE